MRRFFGAERLFLRSYLRKALKDVCRESWGRWVGTPTNLSSPWLYGVIGVSPCTVKISAANGSYSAYRLIGRILITL